MPGKWLTDQKAPVRTEQTGSQADEVCGGKKEF